jgi:hypothetical protein
MTQIKLTEQQLDRLKTAGIAVHDAICPTRAPHAWNACHTSHNLFGLAMHQTIEHLDANPRDAKGARVILHNSVCMSGCEGDSAHEHAKTQTKAVVALRKHLAVA